MAIPPPSARRAPASSHSLGRTKMQKCWCVCGLPGKDSNSSLASHEPCTGGRANRQTDRETASQRDGQDDKEIEQVWFDSASARTLARWILCIIRERLVVIGRLGTWSERQDLAVPIAKQEPCPVTPRGRGTGRRGGTSKAGVPSETLNPAELGLRSTVCPSTSSLMSWARSSAVLLFGSDPVPPPPCCNLGSEASGQSLVSRRGRLMGGDVRASSLFPVNDPYHAVELSMRDGPTSQA